MLCLFLCELLAKQLDKSDLVLNLFLDLRISSCYVVRCFFSVGSYMTWLQMENKKSSDFQREIIFALVISIVVSTKSVA